DIRVVIESYRKGVLFYKKNNFLESLYWLEQVLTKLEIFNKTQVKDIYTKIILCCYNLKYYSKVFDYSNEALSFIKTSIIKRLWLFSALKECRYIEILNTDFEPDFLCESLEDYKNQISFYSIRENIKMRNYLLNKAL